MDADLNSQLQISARKIEDIIDIQKANGKFQARQVVFKLPAETNSNNSTACVNCLETGLTKVKLEKKRKKAKKSRKKYAKGTSDAISWPSDSDITVLRMKLCKKDTRDKMSKVVLGDGLHQPDSSSMVNLATLIIRSQTPSKHSLNLEEYLLPLTSWEHTASTTMCTKYTKQPIQIPNSSGLKNDNQDVISLYKQEDDLSFKNSEVSSETSVKSKVARFLRLYFCPCCIYLYNLETLEEKQKHNYE